MEGWEELKIKEFCEFKYGKNLPEKKRVSGKYPVYGSSSLAGTHNEYLVKGPGIIVGRKGTVGRIQFSKVNFFPIDTTYYLSEDKEQVDLKFLYYRLTLCGFEEMNSDAAVPGLNRFAAINQKIKLPPLRTQRKIASILSAYDDLIENNLKRIKLLEEKAQLTYEEWFVRMKFPGHETTPINTETGLPEGWHHVKLSQIAEFLNGFAFKPKDLGNQGLPVIKIKEMKNGIVNDTPRNNGNGIADKYTVKNGDILFSWSATLEVIIWKYETGLLNQHLFKVTPKSSFGKSFVFLSTKNSLPIFDLLTTGATMKHIKRKELEFIKLNKPPLTTMNAFEREVTPVIRKILNLSKQNQLLKEARDILLPRLMTGLINVEKMNVETPQPATA